MDVERLQKTQEAVESVLRGEADRVCDAAASGQSDVVVPQHLAMVVRWCLLVS